VQIRANTWERGTLTCADAARWTHPGPVGKRRYSDRCQQDRLVRRLIRRRGLQLVGIVVQKYGGSSVADAHRIKQVAQRIVATQKKGNDVVVVVSAMGD